MKRHIHREAWFYATLFGVASLAIFIGATWPFPTLSELAIVAAIIRGALILFMSGMIAGIAGPISRFERGALGLCVGGMMLTTQSLLIPHTPWEAWASIASGAGLMAYFCARTGPVMWEKVSRIGGHE